MSRSTGRRWKKGARRLAASAMVGGLMLLVGSWQAAAHPPDGDKHGHDHREQHADDHHPDHQHDHGEGVGAHVHGLAEINLVIEDSRLIIDMLSPGFNKVGFEHQPRNQEQRQAIAAVKELLAAGEKLFILPAAAQCRPVTAEISSDFDLEPGPGHGSNHGHDHAEFMGLWEFHCARPQHLDHIDFKLFEYFPATRQLRIQAITPTGQVGANLRPQNPRLKL